MEYPFFIWGKGIGENRTLCPRMAGNVPKDLKINDMVREKFRKYTLIPCEAGEIEKRHVPLRKVRML